MMFKFKEKPQGQFNESEQLDWLRLTRAENVGPITFYRLIDAYGSAARALEALPELSKRGGRKKPLTAPPVGAAEKELNALHKLGGQIITAADDQYPLALSSMDDAPPVLSLLGNPQLMSKSCVAMVGARNASLNGRKLAEKLARDLGQRETIIVSGLARGIDTAAHQGSLQTGTIAVVAGGIDVVYPEENQALYDQIKDTGLIIAESPLGQKPFPQSFPRRNRIVSGLSQSVIVVEATMRSGSLITARLAGEQGRDVMAVPGSPMDPRASGPNHLIREGATLIRSADDVMETLQNFSGQALFDIHAPQKPFSPAFVAEDDITETQRENLVAQLSFTPCAVDELIRTCHMSVSAAQTILLELELAGRIKRLPGNRVTLIE